MRHAVVSLTERANDNRGGRLIASTLQQGPNLADPEALPGGPAKDLMKMRKLTDTFTDSCTTRVKGVRCTILGLIKVLTGEMVVVRPGLTKPPEP